MELVIAALALAPLIMLVTFDANSEDDPLDEVVPTEDSEEAAQDDTVTPLDEIVQQTGQEVRPEPPSDDLDVPVTRLVEEPPAQVVVQFEGDEADDRASGGDFDDTLTGGGGDDLLQGGAGRDVLKGDAGDDTLVGASADGPDDDADTLTGGDGDDVLVLGDGDTGTGGGGSDRFMATGSSTVTDFDASEDVLIVTYKGGDSPSISDQSITENGLLITLSDGMTVTLEGLEQAIPSEIVTFLDASTVDPLAA